MVTEPPSVTHEVVRSRVLQLLDRRWEHIVTTVTAGPGFGKSIAVGQAMRANQAVPRGVEAWVSCRSGCEEPGRLAASVCSAFDAPSERRGSPLVQLQTVFSELAPIDGTLLLDDVELLSAAPACVELLDELLRSAPWNLHLVLSGRELPPVPLARLLAAGQVVEVTEDDLRFDQGEVTALARQVGSRVPAQDLGGWPALVRLAVAAPQPAVGAFLWEEVIRRLSGADRRALVALSVLGPTAGADVSRVCGEPFDATAFSSRVPLVHLAEGRVVAHDLWGEFVHELAVPDEVADISRRAVDVVAGRGDALATGALGLRLREPVVVRRAAVALVRANLTNLPVDVATAWLASTEADDDPSPEMDLLACARAHARSSSEPEPARLDAVADAFHSAGDLDAEVVTLAFASVVADANGDVGRLAELAMRSEELAADHPDPILQLLVNGVQAAIAAAGGDIDSALAHLARPIVGLTPPEQPGAIDRLHWRLLLLAGRAGDAGRLASTLGPATDELVTVARWLDGDPSGIAPDDAEAEDRYAGLTERDRFDQASFVAVVAASTGENEAVDTAVDVLTGSPLADAGAVYAARLAVARANQLIVHHDDRAAVAVIDALLADPADTDGMTDAFLRRSLGVPYVCSIRLRERWDAAVLGPSQQRARDIARLLVDARDGRSVATAPEPLASVCTALPLPWSVELAVRAASRDMAWGVALAEDLADRFGPPVAAELARLAKASESSLRRGAETIRRAVPAAPPHTLDVRVLGPLELRHDGEVVVDAPELRRARVRELLSALVVERTIARDRVVELLWPDLDVHNARANLRVTLSHLQRLLEPDRPAGQPPYFVRADGEHVRLAAVAGLTVDLWEVEQHQALADTAQRDGDTSARLQHLEVVAERWRGRPLPDLDRVPPLSAVGRHMIAGLADASLTFGELELVRGSLSRVVRCAEQALAADPYLERAHRLAIAVHRQARDRSATRAAVEDLHAMLHDLGVEPDDTTQMVLRGTAAWLGPHDPS